MLKQKINKSKDRKILIRFLLFHILIISNFLTLIYSEPSVGGLKENNVLDSYNDEITLEYGLNYEYQTSDQHYDESYKIKLEIKGNNLMYDNGTINYFIPEKNITNPDLLNHLELFFSGAQIDFFYSHKVSESFQTYFRHRNETDFEPTNENFNFNARYTPFWLNSSGNSANYLRGNQVIKFFNVSDPLKLAIRKKFPFLNAKTYENEPSDLAKPVKLIQTFHMALRFNELTLDLFYDQKFSVLLNAKLILNDNNGDSLNLKMTLKESNLNFELQETNPFWIERRNKILLITFIGISVIGSITFVYFHRKKKGVRNEKISKIEQI
jgi:hypothetical protein